MKKDWPTRPLSDFVTSRSGNNKIIKGTQSDKPGDGLIQGFSASGPDVWVTTADYNQPGVVISAVGARCGKTFIADGQWTAIANTHVLLPGKDIDPRWLWYRTNDETFWIRGGSAQPFVKVKDTLQQPCIIPPLPEQQRIVGLLDEAFAGIANAQANAEKNLQNARALFESHLQSVFIQRGKGWCEIQLADVCERLHQGLNTAGEKVKFYDSGYPIIQTRNIDDGVVELDSKIKFMCEEDWQLYKDKYRPEIGDVFFTNIGTIGKTAIVTTDRDYLIHWNIFKLRPRLEKITSEFLRYTLKQLTLAGYFEKMQKGGTVDFVTKKMISEALIYLPTIAEQKTIVAILDDLREETQRLARLYERKLAALDALKKSLLHQAFTGEL